MSEKRKKKLIQYGITSVLILAAACIHVFAYKGFGELGTADKYRVLCDAFTIPGVLSLMAGVMVWLTNQGTLTGVTYIFSTGLRTLIPGKGLEKPEKYGDYVAKKREKKVTGYSFLFVCGGVAMAVAAVFLILFYIAF